MMTEKKGDRVKKVEKNMEKVQKKDLVENSDDEGSNSNSDKNRTNDEFVENCEVLIDRITKNYKDQRDEIRKLIRQHKTDMRNAKKTTKKKRGNKKTGFTKPEVVPENLAKFVGLPKGTVMPRTELTKEVYKKIKERKLYYEEDNRVLRADKEIQKLFNLPENVNNSIDAKDKNGFNFFNLQTYIARCYSQAIKIDETVDETVEEYEKVQKKTNKKASTVKATV